MINKTSKLHQLLIGLSLFTTVGLMSGCNFSSRAGRNLLSKDALVRPTLSGVLQYAEFSIEVWDTNAAAPSLIYQESPTGGNQAGFFQIEQNVSYRLVLATRSPSSSCQATLNPIGGAHGASFNWSGGNNYFAAQGLGNRTLEVTCASPGLVTRTKKYSLAVTCPSAQMANFVVGNGTLQVTPDSSSNFYHYTINPSAVSGGSGSYLYSVDFNGDGIPDVPLSATNLSYSHIYSNHVDVRAIPVFVQDSQCFNVKSNHSAMLPNSAPAFGSASVSPMVDANVDGAAHGNSAPALNLRHLSTSVPSVVPNPTTCQFTAGQDGFVLVGSNSYSSMGSGGKPHGMSVQVLGLGNSLSCATGGSGALSVSSAVLNQVQFMTDDSPDFWAQQVFSSGSCRLSNITVTDSWSHSMCSDGVTASGQYSAVIEGKFDCTNSAALTSSTNQKINVPQGVFRCSFGTGCGCPVTPAPVPSQTPGPPAPPNPTPPNLTF